jgi:hypothetical protein
LLQIIYEQQQIRFGNAFKNRQTILQDLFQPNREESEETVENPSPEWTHLAYMKNFPKQMHDLRDICVSLRGQISGGGNY